MNRRQFGAIGAGAVLASGPWVLNAPAEESGWSAPVTDTHLHLRKDVESDYEHLKGSGVTKAVILARVEAIDQVQALRAAHPGCFTWAVGVDPRRADAVEVLTAAHAKGARGIGEIKANVQSDGPELQRLYALAADFNVPILIHFQEVPHYPTEVEYCHGVKRLDSMLKKYGRTKFIGHGDAFWANVSADYADDVAYPSGPIKPGGVSDRWLSDYPNLFGDLSANSANNALSRSPDWTNSFLERHQDKLIFGSDCGCSDGHGHGVGQPNNPAAARLAGQCVARATLTLLTKSCSPAIFRKIVATNPTNLYGPIG